MKANDSIFHAGLKAVFPSLFKRNQIRRYATVKGFDVLDPDGSVNNTIWYSMLIVEGEEVDLEVFDEQEDAEDFTKAYAREERVLYVPGGMDSLGRTFS